METPTLREDVLQGLGVSFDILAAFADRLPFPAPAIFTLAKSVIVNVEVYTIPPSTALDLIGI